MLRKDIVGSSRLREMLVTDGPEDETVLRDTKLIVEA